MGNPRSNPPDAVVSVSLALRSSRLYSGVTKRSETTIMEPSVILTIYTYEDYMPKELARLLVNYKAPPASKKSARVPSILIWDLTAFAFAPSVTTSS